jgi:hypothetical protein
MKLESVEAPSKSFIFANEVARYPQLSEQLQSPVCDKTEERWLRALHLHVSGERSWPLKLRVVQVYDPFNKKLFSAQIAQKEGSARRNESPNAIIIAGPATGGVCVDLSVAVDKRAFLYNYKIDEKDIPATAEVVVIRMMRSHFVCLQQIMHDTFSGDIPLNKELLSEASKNMPGWFIYAFCYFLKELNIEIDTQQLISNTFGVVR